MNKKLFKYIYDYPIANRQSPIANRQSPSILNFLKYKILSIKIYHFILEEISINGNKLFKFFFEYNINYLILQKAFIYINVFNKKILRR